MKKPLDKKRIYSYQVESLQEPRFKPIIKQFYVVASDHGYSYTVKDHTVSYDAAKDMVKKWNESNERRAVISRGKRTRKYTMIIPPDPEINFEGYVILNDYLLDISNVLHYALNYQRSAQDEKGIKSLRDKQFPGKPIAHFSQYNDRSNYFEPLPN